MEQVSLLGRASKFKMGPPQPNLPPPLMSLHTAMPSMEKVLICLEHAPPLFDLKNKILGQGGANLQYIRNETGAIITLRGKGSGFLEPSTGQESHDSLHICVEHQKFEILQSAKQLAHNLVETIQQEFAQFQQQNPHQQMNNFSIQGQFQPVNVPDINQPSIISLQPQPIQHQIVSMSGPPPIIGVPPPNLTQHPHQQQMIQHQHIQQQIQLPPPGLHIPTHPGPLVPTESNLNHPPPSQPQQHPHSAQAQASQSSQPHLQVIHSQHQQQLNLSHPPQVMMPPPPHLQQGQPHNSSMPQPLMAPPGLVVVSNSPSQPPPLPPGQCPPTTQVPPPSPQTHQQPPPASFMMQQSMPSGMMPTTQANPSLNFIETHMYMVPPSTNAPSHPSQITMPPPPPPPPPPQQPMPVPPVNVPNSPVQGDMSNGPPMQQTFLSAPPNGQGVPVSYSYQYLTSAPPTITYTGFGRNEPPPPNPNHQIPGPPPQGPSIQSGPQVIHHQQQMQPLSQPPPPPLQSQPVFLTPMQQPWGQACQPPPPFPLAPAPVPVPPPNSVSGPHPMHTSSQTTTVINPQPHANKSPQGKTSSQKRRFTPEEREEHPEQFQGGRTQINHSTSHPNGPQNHRQGVGMDELIQLGRQVANGQNQSPTNQQTRPASIPGNNTSESGTSNSQQSQTSNQKQPHSAEPQPQSQQPQQHPPQQPPPPPPPPQQHSSQSQPQQTQTQGSLGGGSGHVDRDKQLMPPPLKTSTNPSADTKQESPNLVAKRIKLESNFSENDSTNIEGEREENSSETSSSNRIIGSNSNNSIGSRSSGSNSLNDFNVNPTTPQQSSPQIPQMPSRPPPTLSAGQPSRERPSFNHYSGKPQIYNASLPFHMHGINMFPPPPPPPPPPQQQQQQQQQQQTQAQVAAAAAVAAQVVAHHQQHNQHPMGCNQQPLASAPQQLGLLQPPPPPPQQYNTYYTPAQGQYQYSPYWMMPPQ